MVAMNQLLLHNPALVTTNGRIVFAIYILVNTFE